MSGIVMTLNRLTTAVSEIDNATSPRAKAVKIFDVTPPGAAAIIMTPSASSGCNGHTLMSTKAMAGNKTICYKAPTKNSRGCVATRAKSLKVSPRPSANMINASTIGSTTLVTIPMEASVLSLTF